MPNTELKPPDRLWTELYRPAQCCTALVTIAAYDRNPREAHDNGKPVYEYTRIYSPSEAEARAKEIVEAARIGSGVGTVPKIFRDALVERIARALRGEGE